MIPLRKEHNPRKRMDEFFFEACRRYLKNGGDANYARDILTRAVQELKVEGTAAHDYAPSGRQDTAAVSSFNRGGEGQRSRDDQSASALPVREPTVSQMVAAATVANIIAITVLDSFKVRDGRSIGDVRYGEIERLHGVNAREAHVLHAIKTHIGYAGHDEKIRHLLKAKDLERFIQRAAEISDAR